MGDGFQQLGELIQAEMARLHVPGVAVGILNGEEERVAGFGVTNVEHPLPVDGDTLFQIGSITKTVTATLAMQLVEEGRLALDTPVRAYLPELRLADEGTAERVTLRHLLTHTGGWAGDYFDDLGPGDDALARVVAKLVNLPQVTPLGKFWSYNNAGFYLAGRLLEIVSGTPYEALARRSVLDPLGMSMSFFFPADCITHRVAAGHQGIYAETGEKPKVARPWAVPRALGPVGGIVSTVRDQLRYARFHMGDGVAAGGSTDGKRLLSQQSVTLMQTPNVAAANGEYTGLAWFIRDVPTGEAGGAKLRIVRHSGGTKGQISVLQMAPARRFAISVLTNSERGDELYRAAVQWALRHYLGLEEPEPAPVPATAARLAECAGRYTALGEEVIVRADETGLIVESISLGGFPTPDTPPMPNPPPVRAALCEGDGLLLLDEPARGQRGEFLRDADAGIAWLRLGGRMHARQTG